MHGMIHFVGILIAKAQTALTGAPIGGILMTTGYQVNSPYFDLYLNFS